MFGLPAILVSVALFAPTVATKDIAPEAQPKKEAVVRASNGTSAASNAFDVQNWMHIRGVIDPEVVRTATRILPSLAMGEHTVASVNGRDFLFRAEPHYHPPEFRGGPTGWHKGVTVYQRTSNGAIALR